MINAKQMKAGMVIKVDSEFYQVVSYQHVKPGKGPAYMRTKLKHITDLLTVERTFRSEEKLELAFLEQKKLVFLYNADGAYIFMDSDTYEQVSTGKDMLAEAIGFLKDGQEVTAAVCEGKIINIELPNFITLQITSTEAGLKGDTVKAGNKNACLETGAQISVPLFIKEGDLVKIDTRTKKYLGRT